jgi:hypothetical protein
LFLPECSVLILDETVKATVLENLGDLQVVAEAHYTWEITNYGKLPNKAFSPEFECGGYKWFNIHDYSLIIGVFFSFHGGIIKKIVHLLILKLFHLKMHLKIGMYVLNLD